MYRMGDSRRKDACTLTWLGNQGYASANVTQDADRKRSNVLHRNVRGAGTRSSLHLRQDVVLVVQHLPFPIDCSIPSPGPPLPCC